MADARLVEINETAAMTGNDPALDSLLLRLHTETACRRGGALALRPQDLDPDQCLIFLREKGATVRWQPVSSTLMAHLVRHAAHRGAPRGGQLLRYADGRPITTRRYDHLWGPARQAPAVGGHAADLRPLASPHHVDLGGTQLRLRRRPRLRRTRRLKRRRWNHNHVRADKPPGIAAALAALTGEPHPLA